ncbi:hypothetical protein OHA98_33075 [Streptomyces sp. NBC_00654]|uniref:hypothetical protein n=1 Tax=Streptomyces sp. NBC_00654 TaxID=2975799 RepID=UPI0022527411|nr:hypothetical protein [Streptomyces sp. NBC_00654]MCX4969508.1 hypothetical protein [Streptomyces sp. NBC_00654]
MTLLVHTYLPGEEGAWDFLDDPPDGRDMAGFESCRTRLWGAEPARALGARFLPRLATDMLLVEPEEVADFLAECELLRPHTEALAAHGGYRADYVAQRLANIAAAGERARAVGGGVIVW